MSHKANILAHLKSGKSLTALQALKSIGTSRLAAHIHQLKKEDHEISKDTIEVPTRDGTAWVAEYRMYSTQKRWKWWGLFK